MKKTILFLVTAGLIIRCGSNGNKKHAKIILLPKALPKTASSLLLVTDLTELLS